MDRYLSPPGEKRSVDGARFHSVAPETGIIALFFSNVGQSARMMLLIPADALAQANAISPLKQLFKMIFSALEIDLSRVITVKRE